MSFHTKSWSARYAMMGDRAEQAFRDWAATNNIITEDYGFRRPPFRKFPKIPLNIRHTPDFYCEQFNTFPWIVGANNRVAHHFFVETQGCSRDQIVKVKLDKFQALSEWQAFSKSPMLFFILDSHNNRVSLTHFNDLEAQLDSFEVDHFENDNKPYYAIPTAAFQRWENIN